MRIFNFSFLISNIFLILYYISTIVDGRCVPSITTASGNLISNNRQFCKGELIFHDDFNNLNTDTWGHENTLGGGGVSFFN